MRSKRFHTSRYKNVGADLFPKPCDSFSSVTYFVSSINSDADHCLKYYRASRYHMRCVMIVLVERKCIDCTNKYLHLLKQRIFTNTLTEVTNACRLCEYRTVNERYKNVIQRNLNVYLSNKEPP